MLNFAVVLVLVSLAAGAPSPGIYHGGLAIPAATSYRYAKRNCTQILTKNPLIQTTEDIVRNCSTLIYQI